MSKLFAVKMPKWGIEMEEGTITSWLIDEGADVEKGVDLIDIETSKIVNTLESPYSGKLVRRTANEDDTLTVGALLGVIADGDASDADIDAFIAENQSATAGEAPADEAVANTPAAAAPAPASASDQSGAKVRVSPPVRRLAESLGVDLAALSTGGGRITKQMVEDAAAGNAGTADGGNTPTAASSAKTTVVPMSSRRKTIAKRLVEAKSTIPHYYLSTDINLDSLMSKRADINASGAGKVSVNDMLMQAVAATLIKEPGVNVTLVGDDIHQYETANIAVAVATDDGLIAPVLSSVESMDIQQISAGVKDLADKAVNKKLAASDLENGSFTISNLGMYGLSGFKAIINPPQGAILAVGAAAEKAIVVDGKVAVATMLTVNLSCDHRIIDGAVGAAFLKALQTHIETA